MEVDVLNPLTQEQKQEINQGIQDATTIITAIKKANSAGIDTGDQLVRAEETRQRLISIKQTYFPNG